MARKKVRRNKSEPRGTIKTMILIYILESDSPVSREDIADYITDWSRNKDDLPIRQRQGIYRHLRELVDNKKLIIEDKDSQAYTYTPLKSSLNNFKVICKYVIENKSFPIFMKSDYFNSAMPVYLPEILKNDFNIELPIIIDFGDKFNTLIKAFTTSEVAARFLILEPKKFQLITDKIVHLCGDEADKLDEEELNDYINIIKADEILTKQKFTDSEKSQGYAKRIKIRAKIQQESNTYLSLNKFKSDKEIKDKIQETYDKLHDLLYSLVICYYIDIFKEIYNVPYEEFLKQPINDNLKELINNKEAYTTLVGRNLTMN